MLPTLVHMNSFIVSGPKTRTNNQTEMIPAQARLPLLWGSFLSQHTKEQIPDQVKDSPVYGVYTNYQSDFNGDYDVIVGVETRSTDSDSFSSVKIAEGNYLVFEKPGNMPQVIIETWLAIWDYFSEPQSVTRLYTADFEVYKNDGVAIYIAVEPHYTSA